MSLRRDREPRVAGEHADDHGADAAPIDLLTLNHEDGMPIARLRAAQLLAECDYGGAFMRQRIERAQSERGER